MLKKKDIAEGIVEKAVYPNQGIVRGPEGEKIYIKGVIPGQKVQFRITKKRETHLLAKLLSVMSYAPQETLSCACEAFPLCGGCLYQYLPYEDQLRLKEAQLQELLHASLEADSIYDGILASPQPLAYRNKMEFSFGNDRIGGPLHLGLHKRGTTYDILMGDTCTIVHEDVRKEVHTVWEYCKENDLPHYHKTANTGFLRHLLVRRSESTGELLICLVTTSELDHDFRPLMEKLLDLKDDGKPVRYAGILHGINDLPADTVQYQKAEILYGKDYLTDNLLGLTFRISVFSFFQTNTSGA